jgi:hypothetical protein
VLRRIFDAIGASDQVRQDILVSAQLHRRPKFRELDEAPVGGAVLEELLIGLRQLPPEELRLFQLLVRRSVALHDIARSARLGSAKEGAM